MENDPASSTWSVSLQTPFDCTALDAFAPMATDDRGPIPPTPHQAPSLQAPLTQEAKSQLEQQASFADEQAAVQESQLHNTGRDMGDWLGVDHGVSLATHVSTQLADPSSRGDSSAD